MILHYKIYIFAILGGVIPSLFWLLFWLREAKKKDEPKAILSLIFFVGMLSVFIVIPMQKVIESFIANHNLEIILWASIEEIIKLLVVFFVIYKNKEINTPVKWAIYLITSALGFAALENTLFLMKPFSLGHTTVGILTGQLRFLGSTLLHSIASGLIGISIGLSMYLSKNKKRIYIFSGLILAIALHSLFNFFIMEYEGREFIKVFAFLWIITIIILLLFEKLRRIGN